MHRSTHIWSGALKKMDPSDKKIRGLGRVAKYLSPWIKFPHNPMQVICGKLAADLLTWLVRDSLQRSRAT